MTLDVPAGTYPAAKTFHVSYTPIAGDPSPHMTPLTPLIEVDNGGAFADGIMTVTVPVTIPDGYFAMGFFVDERGNFEGMPLVTETPSSITVATAHFSAFFIAAILSQDLVLNSYESGFRPMTDDWQFPNLGSYISPGGHCMGQSLTAMWYYTEKRQNGAPSLWDRYDNSTGEPTPEFWYDDSNGYRFASTIQEDVDWGSWLRDSIGRLQAGDDILTWLAFLYAMQVTGEPQFVAVYDSTTQGGHALVVYKVEVGYSGSVLTGTLYLADPNYPGNATRKITYANGKFAPYESGANKQEINAGNSVSYDEIYYYAKTALLSWPAVAARWSEFERGTIGDDRFPDYSLLTWDDAGNEVPLTSGATVNGDRLKIISRSPSGVTIGQGVYRGTEWLTASGGTWPLVEGENLLGIYLVGEVGGVWKYVDFQWVTVQSVTPSNVSGRMEFHLAATIQQDPQYGPAHAGVVGTTMIFWNGSYDPATKTVTATWNGGDFSNTFFEARLSPTEDSIESFHARQTQEKVWFAWTNVHEIRGNNLPYSHTEGGSRYFTINGSQARATVDLLTFKTWSTSLGSAQNPTEWVGSLSALTGDAADIITIRLDF